MYIYKYLFLSIEGMDIYFCVYMYISLYTHIYISKQSCFAKA